MKIKYVSRNYKITDNFKDVLEKKINKLDKYFKTESDTKVCCTQDNNKYKLEITVNAGGMYLRSEVVSDNMYDNIDYALPKIERQIVKNSGKYKNRFVTREAGDILEFLSEVPETREPKIVKNKKFALDPLTLTEAENFMEALGHSFYIFQNAKTGQVNVLYKRNDGDLGLIEIEK